MEVNFNCFRTIQTVIKTNDDDNKKKTEQIRVISFKATHKNQCYSSGDSIHFIRCEIRGFNFGTEKKIVINCERVNNRIAK